MGAVSTEQKESSTQEAVHRAESSTARIIFPALECGPPNECRNFLRSWLNHTGRFVEWLFVSVQHNQVGNDQLTY